jgi:serine/threonine-protein kinase
MVALNAAYRHAVNWVAKITRGQLGGYAAGVTAGSYEATELLGTGGIGRVYKAVHRPSGRLLALKTVHGLRAAGDAYRLLVREAAAVAQLRHPSVVELLDFVVDGGRTFLVLELVPGGNADRWMTRPAPITHALDRLKGRGGACGRHSAS